MSASSCSPSSVESWPAGGRRFFATATRSMSMLSVSVAPPVNSVVSVSVVSVVGSAARVSFRLAFVYVFSALSFFETKNRRHPSLSLGPIPIRN